MLKGERHLSPYLTWGGTPESGVYVNPDNTYDRIHADEVAHWAAHASGYTHRTRIDTGFNAATRQGWAIVAYKLGEWVDLALPYSDGVRRYLHRSS